MTAMLPTNKMVIYWYCHSKSKFIVACTALQKFECTGKLILYSPEQLSLLPLNVGSESIINSLAGVQYAQSGIYIFAK